MQSIQKETDKNNFFEDQNKKTEIPIEIGK